jgi:putative ABC transport system ATP-binding protein
VAIARAIVMGPKILLADEPTGNLDTAAGAEIVRLLEQRNAEGLTLVVVTHDPDIGRRAGHRLRLVDGRIVSEEGSRGRTGAAAALAR